MGDLRRSLEAGVDLSGAMAQHPKVFDNFYVSMVRVGEASGQLEEVFKRLAEHLQFEAAMRQQVKSAMRYPSFVIMAMAGAIGVINVPQKPASIPMAQMIAGSPSYCLISKGIPIAAIMTGNAANAFPITRVKTTMPPQ